MTCIDEGRACLGFELYPIWAEMARSRILRA